MNKFKLISKFKPAGDQPEAIKQLTNNRKHQVFLGVTGSGKTFTIENVIEKAMVLCPGNTSELSDIPKEFKEHIDNTQFFENIPKDAKLDETLALIERNMIERALKLVGNVQSNAAELLGIGKSGLNKKIKKYGITVGS